MGNFTYDYVNSPQIAQIRLMVADTDITHPIFDDDEITAALNLSSSSGVYVSNQMSPVALTSQFAMPTVYSPYRAVALLLDCLAANKSRLAAVVSILDVKLSPEKAAQELRATAKEYRDLAANDGSFAIAETVYDQFSGRERVWNTLLRLYGAN